MLLRILLTKTLHSITKPQIMLLMLLCAVLAVVVVTAFILTITWGAAHFIHLERAWLDTTVNWLVGLILGVGGWFMLPVAVILIAGIFQEITIHRLEKAEYPEHVRKTEPGFWPDLAHDIRFTLKALLLNLLILPFYFFGIGFALSIVLNSYLLGREFFEGAAGYHLGKPKARKLGSQNKKFVYGSGFILTLMTLMPLINLFVPIIAVVWMDHLYHELPVPRGTVRPKSA